MSSSFESKARRAIERVALSSEGDTLSHCSEEKWRLAVHKVLMMLIPTTLCHEQDPKEWALSIRDELLRLQNEGKMDRKEALAVLETRLDVISRIADSAEKHDCAFNDDLVLQKMKKLARPSPTDNRHAIKKKLKLTRKRSLGDL